MAIDIDHIERALTYSCPCGAKPGEQCFYGTHIPRAERDEFEGLDRRRDRPHMQRLDRGLHRAKRTKPVPAG